MRRQTLIALGVALLLGLFAVYLGNVFLSRTEQKAAAVPDGMTKVAVAAVPLDYGVEITPDKIRFADYPVSSVPPGSFRSISQLLPMGKRRVALRPMLVNEPILANKVSGEGQGASIAALLPDGKRAAAVRINDVSGVAGFVQPNDSVDVLVTRQAGGSDAQVTDLLLQNVRVIAIDQDAKGADGAPTVGKTATLEVDPLDAQKLALAQQVGQLSLVLRKPGDVQDSTVATTVSLNDLRYSLYGGARYPAAAVPYRPTAPRTTVRRVGPRPSPVVRAAPQPRTSNVQIVRGTEGNSYEVGDYGS
ncbi:Flp pilus assembly protein CpaB [Sphingomonas sp.]|uniref:Flp pilus assembly protein CpaB n=1 Tax=Sphingomonas sp. TaxID=28214 RepID=UPI0017BA5658|nr:Flp pilus assembly protein CpaB [Sphingomonas sp.]MBA3511793.1 Flp pilus assembly protein CpaB [Sphingomonas sp.]